MNEVMEKPADIVSTALVTMDPEKYVAAVFVGFRRQLDAYKVRAASAAYDVTTTAGMKVAVDLRAEGRSIRVASEKARKERKAPILEIGKLLDSKQKELEAEISPLESKFDDDIKAEENRKEADRLAKLAVERARREAIEARIDVLVRTPLIVVGQSSVVIDRVIQSFMTEVLDGSYEDLLPKAQAAHAAALAVLQESLTNAINSEKEALRIIAEREAIAAQQAETARQQAVKQKELDDQRAEQEAAALAARQQMERERSEHADLIAEQERKAAAQRRIEDAAAAELRHQADEELAAQRAELQRQQDAINEQNQIAASAEQARIDAAAAEQAEKDRIAQAEADRLAQEKLSQEAAAAVERQRVADEDHISDVHAKIALGFSEAGFIPEMAWKAMVAIAAGKIPHLSIIY
ncbi:MAG: hypothetical protein JWP38_3693 [Herbaspirillum sp.]|nr:hypothetical protein [Herbaspirillum sp.]